MICFLVMTDSKILIAVFLSMQGQQDEKVMFFIT